MDSVIKDYPPFGDSVINGQTIEGVFCSFGLLFFMFAKLGKNILRFYFSNIHYVRKVVKKLDFDIF